MRRFAVSLEPFVRVGTVARFVEVGKKMAVAGKLADAISKIEMEIKTGRVDPKRIDKAYLEMARMAERASTEARDCMRELSSIQRDIIKFLRD